MSRITGIVFMGLLLNLLQLSSMSAILLWFVNVVRKLVMVVLYAAIYRYLFSMIAHEATDNDMRIKRIAFVKKVEPITRFNTVNAIELSNVINFP